jgi:nucleotide-binding universal stress UspA family protein
MGLSAVVVAQSRPHNGVESQLTNLRKDVEMSNQERSTDRVIVGLDGSHEAGEALRWAVGEATQRHAVLQVTSCWLYPALVGPGALFPKVYEFPDLALDICEKAKATAASIAPDLVIEIRTPEIQPALGLVDTSREADLLVVGARGLGAFRALLLGSVSQHCAQYAHCPVMIVRPSIKQESATEQRGRKVVVGIDGSKDADAALSWAVEEARRLNASLEVVGAWPLPAKSDLTLVDEQAAMRHYAQNSLEHAAKAASAACPDVEVTTTLSVEPASWALVEASERADLLVVGCRGLGGFQSMMLGSVSQHCATHAKCPTLIVRHPHQ